MWWRSGETRYQPLDIIQESTRPDSRGLDPATMGTDTVVVLTRKESCSDKSSSKGE